jgi:hypothetical protein
MDGFSMLNKPDEIDLPLTGGANETSFNLHVL